MGRAGRRETKRRERDGSFADRSLLKADRCLRQRGRSAFSKNEKGEAGRDSRRGIACPCGFAGEIRRQAKRRRHGERRGAEREATFADRRQHGKERAWHADLPTAPIPAFRAQARAKATKARAEWRRLPNFRSQNSPRRAGGAVFFFCRRKKTACGEDYSSFC